MYVRSSGIIRLLSSVAIIVHGHGFMENMPQMFTLVSPLQRLAIKQDGVRLFAESPFSTKYDAGGLAG